MAVAVSTPVFEGPFDLLLHLILKDEVDLYSVSLNDIVAAYLAELDHLESLELELATEFLLIASTLVELKSRRLLPDDGGIDLDEELALWEERDLLLARLLECKTFKDAALALEAFARDASRSFPRLAGLEERFIGLVPDLLDGVTVEQLRDALGKAMTPRPKPTIDFFHVTPVKLTVAETVASLADELARTGRTTFMALTRSLVDRIEVVVYFLALLELYKQGWIELAQAGSFASITVEWVGTAGEDRAGNLVTVDAYEG